MSLILLASFAAGPLTASENMVQNGGFEELDPSGWPKGWTRSGQAVVRSVAYAGARSIELPATSTGEPGVFQDLSLEPGRQYVVSVVVRTRGLTGAGSMASFLLEHLDSSGKTVGSVLPDGFGSSLDWQLLRIVTPRVPNRQATTRLGLSVAADGPEGSSWFDEVLVREYEAPILDARLLYPNYRGLLGERTWEPTQIRALCAINAQGSPLASLRVSAEVRDARGAILWNSEPAVPPSESFEQGFDVRWIIRGKYELWIALKKTTDQKLAETKLPFEVSHVTDLFARPAFIRADGALLVEGRPVFPLGLIDSYDPGDEDATGRRIAMLKGSPFNVIINDRLRSAKQADTIDHIKDLAALDVLSLFPAIEYDGVGGAAASDVLSGWNGSSPQKRVAACARALRQLPGFLGWFTGRGLQPQYAGIAESRFTTLKTIDPGHPVAMQIGDGDAPEAFREAADLFTTRIVIGQDTPADLTERIRAAAKPYRSRRPVWTVLDLTSAQSTPPSRGETREAAYLALVHGASGLLFENLADLLVHRDAQRRWKELKQTAAELREIESWFLEGAENPLPQISPTILRADAMHRVAGTKSLLIIVNRSEEVAVATVNLSTAVERVDVLFEGRTIVASEGTIVDRFAPRSLHVYAYEAGLGAR